MIDNKNIIIATAINNATQIRNTTNHNIDSQHGLIYIARSFIFNTTVAVNSFNDSFTASQKSCVNIPR